jgi:hypothetical protein
MINLSSFLARLFAIACLFLNSVSYAGTPENQVKASFLIWFGELTTWPEEKMVEPNFVICLSSESDLKPPLEEVKNHLIKNKPLKIEYDVPANQINSCHILYVEEKNHKVFIQTQQKSDPILTVSSDAGFVKEGGVIEFYRVEDHIKMRGSLKAMNKLKLLVSSKLLQLMDISN